MDTPQFWLTPNLKTLREERNLTSRELAESAGVDLGIVLNAENRVGVPASDIERLADCLQLGEDELCSLGGRPWIPYWPDEDEVQQNFLIQKWEQFQETRRTRSRQNGRKGGRPKGSVNRKPEGAGAITEPSATTRLIAGEPPMLEFPNHTVYQFDGTRWRSQRGRVQAGGAVPVFGMTICRHETGFDEQELADRSDLRWVYLRDLLREKHMPTVAEWFRLWEALGRPDPDLLMWGEGEQLVPLRRWRGMRERVEERLKQEPPSQVGVGEYDDQWSLQEKVGKTTEVFT